MAIIGYGIKYLLKEQELKSQIILDMPLFMDLHISPTGDIPIDELLEKHKLDLAIQHKYGVEFKKMWVNKERGMVFCLMEGPDKNACSSVHQQAHEDNGCNIIEVSQGEYDKFLSSSDANEYDIAEIKKGIMDTAYRTIVWFEVIDPLNWNQLNFGKVKEFIRQNRGTLLLDPKHSIKGVFISPGDAFQCAKKIKRFSDKKHIDPKLAIVSGKPVEKEHDKFYGYTMDLCHNMSIIGRKASILTTQLTVELLKNEGINKNFELKHTEVLSLQDENFLNRLMVIIQENFKNPDFKVTDMAAIILLSRSQLFKKIKKLTGFTPNTLIMEFRLYEALKLLDRNDDQIAQIAFDTGFNSPSYFSKVFEKRFHILPSNYIDLLTA